MVRYQPYTLALQTRFKFRHKETDKWRRLMDSSCFMIDWITRPSGTTFTQSGGFWSHIITPAHVTCPWDYPNYYPPSGATKYVSHVSYPDTRTQVRVQTLQGNAAYRYFLSSHHTYQHSNPKLDLSCLHADVASRRNAEMRMAWIQNEGYLIRPRLEIVNSLKVGDVVWIYGMTAYEHLLDVERHPEPKMVPTGFKGHVAMKTDEVFFVDTHGEYIDMGMCGACVIKEGKCVGMLTAKVHEDSSTTELQGMAMCCYSQDIFDFLLSVEEQLKNVTPSEYGKETSFREKRKEEADAADPFEGDQSVNANFKRSMAKDYRDYELDLTRAARLVPNPLSLWRFDEDWHTGEEARANELFGNNGFLSTEALENVGFSMDTERHKSGRPTHGTTAQGDERGVVASGERKDASPEFVDTYGDGDEKMKRGGEKESPMARDVGDLFKSSMSGREAAQASFLSSTMAGMERAREQNLKAEMKATTMQQDGTRQRNETAGDYDAHGNFTSREMQEREMTAGMQREINRLKEAAAGGPKDTPAEDPPSRDDEEVMKRRMQRRAEREKLKAERNRKHEKELRQRHKSSENIFMDQIREGGVGVANPELFTDDRTRGI